ncbi:hypothetical protein AABB24_007681 [Solanum stoloniferum]|uniref:Protein TSSC4 n=2 Tax=Solanum TaxID=4107 RepID=A0AAF0QM81_SOLVR|nr:uncharacterized protein LOC125833264 [Solanum verrucosum]WMV24980.1 hypothetical protein MTR67_018365 [Solanum verrucosum]
MDDESFRARVHKVFGCLSPSASVWSLSDDDVEKKEWNRSALKQGKDDDDHNLCSSSYDELFKQKRRNIQNVINDDENRVDDVWEIRSSIGLDSTLDNEEEEDEYDRVAEGRVDARDRLYMKNIVDQETSCDPPGHNICRDPRANHMAAQVRLKEDADAAEKCETDFDGITLSGGQHSAKSLQDHCNVKPILKKARKSVNGEVKSTKRVRFDPGCKDESDGASELKVSWAAPASANSTFEDNESISSRLKVPDYVLNPSKYTCYSLDSPSELIDEPSQAFGYVLEEVEKSKDDVVEQETIDMSDTNPKSVVFVPRQKNTDAIGATGATVSKGMIEDACNESLHPKGFPVCIAAGEAQRTEDPMEEDMEARVAENNIVPLKPERRYRIKAGMEDT